MGMKWFRYLLMIIAAVILTGCNTDEIKTTGLKKEITMFVTNDIHYLSKDLYVNNTAFQNYLESSDGKMINYIDEIMLAFTNDIARKKPDILIISGDLTNNGEKQSHITLAEKLADIEQTGTQVYVVPGNHDISNPWARGFHETQQYITETINADDFEEIYNSFGYKEAISRDKASLSYLAAPADNMWLLMLDTSIYDFNELTGAPTTNGELNSETLEWIRECSQLAKKKKAQIVTVMHHNLIDHSQILNSGFTLDNNDQVQEVFQECGIPLVLSGHVHIQDIKSIDVSNKPIYDIATSALSVNPVQYGVLKFKASEGFDYSTAQVDVKGWAKESVNSDDNLIYFDEYSKSYFADLSFDKAYSALAEVGSYSEYEKERMAETMSLININYFAGTIPSIKEEVMKTEGYQLWVEAKEPEFLKKYIISMIADSNTSSTTAKITANR